MTFAFHKDLETLKEFPFLFDCHFFGIFLSSFPSFESFSTGWPCRNSSRIQCWDAWWFQVRENPSREAGAIRLCLTKEWGFFLPDKFLEFFRQIDSVEIRAQFYKLHKTIIILWGLSLLLFLIQLLWGFFRLWIRFLDGRVFLTHPLLCAGNIQRSCMLRTEIR